MIRGIERTAMFRDDRDRDSFLDRFGDILLGSSTLCYAWALVNNPFSTQNRKDSHGACNEEASDGLCSG